MKTDRELLELAAKAAGISLDYRMASDAFYYDDEETGREEWNPIGRDGQAFRLALTLNMDIEIGKTFIKATWYDLIKSETHTTEVNFTFPQDKAKCAKRAIVLAAAEIGASL